MRQRKIGVSPLLRRLRAAISAGPHGEPAASVQEERLCLELNFKAGGNGLQFLGTGWNSPDRDHTWTVGYASELVFFPPARGRYALCLDATALSPQRLSIALDGVTAKSCRLAGPCSVTLPIDVPATGVGRPVTLRLDMPDANSPAVIYGHGDTRILGFAVARLRLLRRETALRILPALGDGEIERATRLTRSDLMFNFESLGFNCELGMVQRRCGAEPMGLLRFSSITLPNLLHALATDFDQLGQPDAVRHIFWERTDDPEYIIRVDAYGLEYHSGLTRSQIEPGELYKREAKRLAFYRRKFLEDLAEGRKIFVFHSPGSLMTREVMPLVEALNKRGGNTLLWVLASSEYPPGTVELLAPGLLRGYVDALAPLGTVNRDVDLPPWLSVCANAFRVKNVLF